MRIDPIKHTAIKFPAPVCRDCSIPMITVTSIFRHTTPDEEKLFFTSAKNVDARSVQPATAADANISSLHCRASRTPRDATAPTSPLIGGRIKVSGNKLTRVFLMTNNKDPNQKQQAKSPENSISIQEICRERPSTAVKMNVNSEQTLTEYPVARNEYKAATIESRNVHHGGSGFLAGRKRATASGLAAPAVNPSVPL